MRGVVQEMHCESAWGHNDDLRANELIVFGRQGSIRDADSHT